MYSLIGKEGKQIKKMDWKYCELFLCALLLFCGLQVANSVARQNPLKDPKICGRPECDIDSPKFSYDDSLKYKYEYAMHIRTEFFGSGQNTSDLYFNGKVNLIFPQNCEGVLTLSNIEIREKQSSSSSESSNSYDYNYDYDVSVEELDLHGKSRDIAKALEANKLRFAYHDGLIGEVCPVFDEPIWVLNFKKGILSTLQNTMLRFDVDLNTTETDVSGVCNVAYNLEGAEKTSVLLTKHKNIESCRNSNQMHSILQTTPYNFRDNREIWPILSSESYCNITVDHNVYKNVKCYERHQLVPFSQNQTGAVTISNTELKLVSEEKYQAEFLSEEDLIIKKRSTLLFDQTPTPKPTHGEIKASRDLLKEMCRLGFPDIQREFIDVFTKFLQTTRLLQYKALHQLLTRSPSICLNGRNHVLESLPYIASTASYQLMRDQIVNELIPKNVAQTWITSLAFLPRPDEETLETFYTILQYAQKKIEPEFTLGATAVIHTFCRHHSDCDSNEIVLKIINLLQEEFLKLLQSNNQNERRIKERSAIVLKGLGNIGIMTEEFEEHLKQLIVNETNLPIETRLQAVIAFRRTNCLKNREFFLNVYQDFTMNSEIRIFSYLQSMRCPDYISIHIIKDVLENEEINQVGSYVWSHLTNIAKSASPVRVEAQGLLLNEDLGTKYKMDIRKFSRNYEHSIFFDEYNFGTATDANIIFGTDSYLPRIVTLNFTADLFGESVNFLEISARAQGYEQLITSIFGPKGPLNSELFRKKLSFLTKYFGDYSDENNDDELINLDRLRLKRSNEEYEDYKFESSEEESKSDEKLSSKSSEHHTRSKIHEDIDKLGYKLDYNHGQPRATIGLRVFGNDLNFLSLDGLGEVAAASLKINPVIIAAKLLSGKQVSYRKSGVFLDASYKIPMSSGLPLSIHAFGASSIDFALSGNLNQIQHPEGWHFDVEGKLKPSVSVDILTTMEADFFHASSGIRVKSNFYSSSSLESKLKMRGSKLVSLTFGLPQAKNEIFSARSELLVIKESGDISQPGIEKRSSNSTCSWPILDSAIGLRICSQYSLPDVSNSTDDIDKPGLVLSGPIDISVHLEKIDKNVKNFVLEYKLEQIENTSFASFIFETPDSVIQRIATANFTKFPDGLNASMSFVLGENSHSAVGIYVANPDERRLEVYIENNGEKDIALEMIMNRTEIRNGWIYYPACTLLVNNEIKAAMRGTVKASEKNGIAQNDIDLTFETKILQARVVGFVVKTEIRTTTNLSAAYRFDKNETETIKFEGEWANKSHKSKLDLQGMVKFFTTAYPKLNFASNVTWLSLLAHTEAKLTYNNALDFKNPNYTTTLRGVFSRNEREPEKRLSSRTRASVELTRPISNINLGLSLNHAEYDKYLGPGYVLTTALKYAPQKQVTGVFIVQIQKRKLLAFDISMNVTVPEFDSCTARLNLIEIKPRKYLVNFNGTWFTKHSIVIDGNYNNLGFRSDQHHTLDLNISSPSFDNTNITFLYKRNSSQFLTDFHALYNNNPYDLSVNYIALQNGQKRTKIILKIVDKIYWLSAKLLTNDGKLMSIEFHIDKIRDILLNIRALRKLNKKELSVELKWDANRDPSQRLAISAEFNNPSLKKYGATVLLTYPDRTFTCGFEAYTGGPNYYGNGRVSWNTNDAIFISYDAGLKPNKDHTNCWIHADLQTPFDGWNKNSYIGGIYSSNNLLLVNSSLLWSNNQNLGIIYKSDYLINDSVVNFEISMDINSTVQDIPKMNGHIKYQQKSNEFQSSIGFGYTNINNTIIIYSIDSDWKLQQNDSIKTIIGELSMKSPYDGYRTGNLLTKLSSGINNNRVIKAGARLYLENKLFTLDLDGYIKKITDNMLQINITTPITKYKYITGRFGLNEPNRHAVAQINAPVGSLGAEILLAINNFVDFDIKLSCATPIESFKWMAIFAKMKPDTMDWRCGWNNITLGFTGVWKMNNLTDFEYSYRVFTPLKNFEDNGVVIKLLNQTDQFIFESYGQLSIYKLGLKLKGKPMSKLLKELGWKDLRQHLTDNNYFQLSSDDLDDSYDPNDLDDLYSCIGTLELDTIIYPTITGTIRIQEVTDFYAIRGNIVLPQGKVDISDYVYYPDMLHIENMLLIDTPFPFAKELKSKFQYHIEFKKMYIAGLEFSYKAIESNWTDVGYYVKYQIAKETDSTQHEVDLTVKTPFELLPKIDLNGLLELEEFIYKANFTSKTSGTFLSLGGSIESDVNFLEASLGIHLNTQTIAPYDMHLFFKKEFNEIENIINFGFEILDNHYSNDMSLLIKWNPDKTTFLNGYCRFETNVLPLKTAELTILMTRSPNPIAQLDVILIDKNNQHLEFKTKAMRKKDVVTVDILTPMKQFRNITINGILTKDKSTNSYFLKGDLKRNQAQYGIEGIIVLISDFPIKINLLVKPKINGPTGVIKFSIENTPGDYGKTFQFSSIEDGKMCQIAGGFSIRSNLDWEVAVLIQSTELEISRINLNAKIKPIATGKFIGNFELETPWKHLGIETVKLYTNIEMDQETGKIQNDYELENQHGSAICQWSWILMENMQLSLESSTEYGLEPVRRVQANVRYLNPNRNFQRLTAGGKLNINSEWLLELNSSLNLLSQNDIYASIITQLPEPVGDIHHLSTRYRGNLIEHLAGEDKEPINVFAEGKYESELAKRKFLSKGSYRNVDDLQGIGRIEWGKDQQQDVIEGDFQMLRKGKQRKEFYAKLITPYYKNEDSLFISGNYDLQNFYYLFGCSLNSPASKQLAETDIRFSSLSNLNGFVNATVPFFNSTWIRGDFNFSTTASNSLRYIKAAWPNDSAFIKLISSFKSKDLNRDLQGTITMEVPLTTRHFANIEYGFKERNQLNTGHAVVNYNDAQILTGQYTCKTEERAGFEKDVVDITLENDLKPLGIHYLHSKQYTNAEFPDYDMKHVEIYELRKSDVYNITGEFHIRSTDSGQEYKIIAIHPNRTVILNSEYDYKDSKSKQKSKLQLSPTAWISYNLEVENKTTSTNESQNFIVELSYPKRSLYADGWYYMTDDLFDSDLAFKWTTRPKSDNKKYVRTGLKWKNEPLTGDAKEHQTAVWSIGHPSFDQDITFKGLFYRSPTDLLKAELLVDYCDNPSHHLEIRTLAKDLTNQVGYYNYSIEMFAVHNASMIAANAKGSASVKPSLYQTYFDSVYKRGYYPESRGLLLARLDLNNKEIEYERASPLKAVRFWALPYGSYPVYGINATVWNTPNVNSTGFFYIDLNEKYTRAEVNLTPDATQNLQMIGFIPDARSGYFDIWRNYEEIRVIDVASFIRMNHSRLLSGQFHWRPKIKTEIKNIFKSIGESFYESFAEGIDFWIKQLYSEGTKSVNEILYNVKDKTKGFMDDLAELQILEDDLKDFRIFVNGSYESNDFYIKTLVNFTLTVLEELAIRDQIQSLPKIISEIWQVMGNSGKAFRTSIINLIKMIKTSYQNALEAIGRFFHGESLDHLSKIMEKAVERYDKFIKDLHISFIKYIENLWTKLSNVVSNYWKSMLKKIEPQIFRFIHYLEQAAWNFSKEIFDFIYKRTNELAESPYFSQVSHFTRDLDLLYKDIQSNDLITNFRKYSSIAWDFIKEKYFKLIPFGKELNDVLTELWIEIKSLQNLQHIQIFLKTFNEVKNKMNWLADELQLDYRIHQLWKLVRNKIGSYTMTALQTDDMYREAKTMFIFDPDIGVVELVQKLPMSWHAFNETPKFEEIPEYKFVTDLQNYFGGTNFSLITWIYTVKSNLDPKTWLPPYNAHSLLIGSRHYMTFDKKHVGLKLKYDILNNSKNRQDPCSYLLAHDFFQRNFTLLLEPSVLEKGNISISTRKLSLLTDNQHLELDITADSLRIGKIKSPTLPAKIGETIIYRDSDVVIIESQSGYTLNCNLLFDLCWFELGSWYYGQTAGILGTMNNEIFDDYTTSTGKIATEQNEFIDSWRLNQCKPNNNNNITKSPTSFLPSSTVTTAMPSHSSEIKELCYEYFKTSYFGNCFEQLDPRPFYEMCLDMGSNSISTVMKDNHPAQKGACTAALGYIEACAALKIPLRVPDNCVHCNLINGSYVVEGTFVNLNNSDIESTTDVVFIVEAKSCNKNITKSKNIMTVVTSLEEELNKAGIKNNRYSVIAFGGRTPFDKPRNIIYKNQIFTSDYSQLKQYFDHIEASDGMNNDIFGAISTASKLIFRPGASKTFILLPCSGCTAKDMKLDYSSLLQLMLEDGIKLHILMDHDFVFDKHRLNRVFFGMDRDLAYSKRDLKEFTGDSELRQQVRLPKNVLASCIPLAIETNGAVFTARKLRSEKQNPIKKLSTIFAKRVTKTAHPDPCQICECTGHNTGIAYMTCMSCYLPSSDGFENDDFDLSDIDLNMDEGWDEYDDDLLNEEDI